MEKGTFSDNDGHKLCTEHQTGLGIMSFVNLKVLIMPDVVDKSTQDK